MQILVSTIKSPFIFSSSPVFSSSKSYSHHQLNFTSKTHLQFQWLPIKSCISNLDIDMVKTKTGIYAPKSKKVVVLWDLDNKPPRGPPYEAAVSLKSMAQKFGDVIDISAYANRHAFVHLPQWVVEERRERRHLDILERKGVAGNSSEPYVCNVCGRKCKTNLDLKKHFKQLHERERQKKLGRMRSLKGKKRQRFKERFIDGNEKYNEAARSLLTPKIGYGLAEELKRAGVFVKTVQDKPQAADWALKRQMVHSMSRGVDWIVLVSDDSDFSEMLRKAREASLGTVVVGDRDGALGRHADVWVPWVGVENGDVSESDLELRRGDRFTVTEFDGEVESPRGLDEILGSGEFGGAKVSAFSEGEEYEEETDGFMRLRLYQGDGGSDRHRIWNSIDSDDDDEEGDYFLDSEDDSLERGEENDVYI